MDGSETSMEDIIDDFFVFMVAGMETTAITMSVLVWILLKHPEISRKVVKEVDKYFFLLPFFLYIIDSNCR